MRMLASLLPLLLLGAAQPAPPAAAIAPVPTRLISPTPNCETMSVALGERDAMPRKLGELPPADAYQAVYRLDARGCIDPLLVSERIGATGRRPGR